MSFTYAWLGSTDTAQENKLLALAISAAVPVFLWGSWNWRNKKKPDKDEMEPESDHLP